MLNSVDKVATDKNESNAVFVFGDQLESVETGVADDILLIMSLEND